MEKSPHGNRCRPIGHACAVGLEALPRSHPASVGLASGENRPAPRCGVSVGHRFAAWWRHGRVVAIVAAISWHSTNCRRSDGQPDVVRVPPSTAVTTRLRRSSDSAAPISIGPLCLVQYFGQYSSRPVSDRAIVTEVLVIGAGFFQAMPLG